ncbi:MAG: helix-turn-helix domain-containing protein, partial [Desulfatirhabdiaceae bacterium]
MIKERSTNVNDSLADGRRKNWFWDFNDVFSSDLSAYAKLVRLYIARCANQDRQAWPSYNRIAKECG